MEWFDNFFYQKLKSKRVIAIGLFDENYETSEFLLLENVKGEINKVEHHINQSLEEVLALCKLNPEFPIVISLDNSNVLISENNSDGAEFNEDDFILVNNEEYNVSCVLRRQEVLTVLENFSNLENNIVGFHLSAIGVLDYIQFSSSLTAYHLGVNTYELIDENINVSSLSSSIQKWEGQDYDSKELLLHLVGSDYFVSGLDGTLPEVKPSAINYSYQKLYRKVILFGSVVCVMLFLLSAGIFLAYDQEVKSLEAEFKSNIELRNKYQFYSKSIRELESKLNVNSRDIKYARLSTEIAYSLPSKINLKQLTIDPMILNSASRSGKFQDLNVLRIKGECNSLKLISNWVSDLKNLAWVEDISKQEVLNEKGQLTFTIEVIIKDVR